MRAEYPPQIGFETHYGRVLRCFSVRPSSLAASLAAAAARSGGAEALVDGARRLTYRQFADQVASVAAGLDDLGVKHGDRVALLLANRLEFPVLLYACAVVGAIAVPMNLRQSADETAFALNQSGAVALFHEADARLPCEAEAPKLHVRICVDDMASLPTGAARTFPDVDEDAPFCILYTSGTTGRPKGAVLTHFNVLQSALHFRHHYALEDGERSVLAVPASHVTGLVALIAVSVEVAGCLVLMRRFEAGRFLEIAAAERMTYTLIVPAMVTLALMHPAFDGAALRHWRVCGFGGAPMPDATIAELAERLPGLALHNTYGATETASPAVIMPASEAAARSRQLGLPVLTCNILVMDQQGRALPPGEQGEIWISGPMVIPGYWDNPEATAAAFTGSYWKSGDLGSIDADGFVSLHDRIKDMINRGGFKIYSVEVENVLCELPEVIEAAIVGKPCPVLGERVVAFLHLDPAVPPIDEDTLRAHCAARLSDYKVPETYLIEPSPLPRNANGKLVKTALRARLAAAAA
ncbi:MAG: AMP-binding protein [Sphingomonadales bacterium]|nr:AMP-binding protein [Sphingomonadales bacterium]